MHRRITLALVILALSGLLLASFAMADPSAPGQARDLLKNQGTGWLAGKTTLSDLTYEQKMAHLGWRPSPNLDQYPKFHSDKKIADVPRHLDWSEINGGYVTPVRDQADCGSCYAFSGVGAVEANWAIRLGLTNPQLDLSEQFIVSCYSILGCDGGFMTDVLITARDVGIPDENCFEYDAWDDACGQRCGDWPTRTLNLEEFQVVLNDVADTQEEYEQIILALQEGPLTVGFDVYEDFFNYTYGIWHDSGMYMGGHGVVMVGYDIDSKYWICKNSWGYGWGESGYFRIAWGESNMGREMLLPVPPACTKQALIARPVTPGAEFVQYQLTDMPVTARVTNDCGRGVAGVDVTATYNGQTILLYDDGAHGDVGAGDGVFHCTVPAALLEYGPATILIEATADGMTGAEYTVNGQIKYPADLLIIADDGEYEGDAFYTGVLDQLGIDYDVWQVSTQGDYPNKLLAKAPAVLWFTGPSLGSFADDEETAMKAYLDGGGKLFIAGQDLLQNIYDTRTSFVRQYLKVANYNNDMMTPSAKGITGEPLTDNLGCQLTYPFTNYSDTIRTMEGATAIWSDPKDRPIGLKYPADGVEATYQVVLNAFPLEAMKSDVAAEFLQRVWDWFFADQCLDTDGDGYGIGGACTGEPDCQNDDPAVYPGALEICDDGKDNNCDGLTDSEDPICPDDTDDDNDSGGDDDSGDDDNGSDDDDAAPADSDDDDDDNDGGCGC
ncbi:MAG: hypothetical protein GX444_12860 [Myxococcales bacterium]|nr:hypothetical protein [Myxococcales bacterium]